MNDPLSGRGADPVLTRRDAIARLISEGRFRLVLDEAAGYPMRVYETAPASLRDVFAASARFGDLPFLILGTETLTYAEQFGRVSAFAHHLQRVGVRKGDRVAIGMRNVPEWSIAFWACQVVGAIVVSLNAWWTGQELRHALEDSEPVALVLDGERLERVRSLPTVASASLYVTRRNGHGEEGIDFAHASLAASGGELPTLAIEAHDVATILYTSGTTGRPKGAMATHRNHITNMMNGMVGAAAARLMGGLPAEMVDPTPETQGRVLQTFPFFHMAGLGTLITSLALGGRQVLMHKWSAREAVDSIEQHGITSVSGVPLVVRQLLEEANASGRSISTVTTIGTGGSSVPPDLIEQIGDRFAGMVMPVNGYGLTETTSGVIANNGLEYLAYPDSVGRPHPPADIRIVKDDGEIAAPGEVGEIWVRGPNVIPGYWRDPAATEAAFGGGWFRTGDLGHVDVEGLYYVVDRKKDVIIRGGENVYCAEVEAELVAQPGVLDAAVFGIPHPLYGEEVAALVRVDPGLWSDQRFDDVLAALGQRLARFKIPSAIATTEEELPRNATGKLLKNRLREQFAAAGGITRPAEGRGEGR